MREPFGTTLVLEGNTLQQELWEGDLIWTRLARPSSVGPSLDTTLGEAARRLEIFLDCLLAKTRSTAYLLNANYKGSLSEAEKVLAKALEHFRSSVPADAKKTPAWSRISALLRSLGAEEGHS